MRSTLWAMGTATAVWCGAAMGAIIPPTVEWSAATYGGSGNWNAHVAPSGVTAGWGAPGTYTTGTSNLGTINAWFNSPASNGMTGTSANWQTAFTNGATQENASWELVVRLGDSFVGTHVLFEVGGSGAGSSFVLSGSTLEFRVQNTSDTDQWIVLSQDLSDVALGIDPSNDFIHIAATVDVGNPGTARLYVNGASVDGPLNSVLALNDWAGTDSVGLGVTASTISGDPLVGQTNFDGDVALIRWHRDTLLSPTDVADHFNAAAVPEPGALAFLTLGVGAMLVRRRSKQAKA